MSCSFKVNYGFTDSFILSTILSICVSYAYKSLPSFSFSASLTLLIASSNSFIMPLSNFSFFTYTAFSTKNLTFCLASTAIRFFIYWHSFLSVFKNSMWSGLGGGAAADMSSDPLYKAYYRLTCGKISGEPSDGTLCYRVTFNCCEFGNTDWFWKLCPLLSLFYDIIWLICVLFTIL